MSRKTVTSSEVKARYNRKAYDYLSVPVHKGSRVLIQERAMEQGMTVSGYIKHLIIADMQEEFPDISAKIGGGYTNSRTSNTNVMPLKGGE